MDIQTIKEKLARVGLPLHGTDEELIARAKANGLIVSFEDALKEMASAVRIQENNAADAFNRRPDVRAILDEPQPEEAFVT